MADQPLSFNAWARERRGMRGQLPDTPENRRLMLDLQRQHADYMKQFDGSGFTPSTGNVTNSATGDVLQYFMSSPNSAQVLPQKSPPLKERIGKDGKAYNYNPATGTYTPAMIEGTTNQFEADPKSNRVAELMDLLGGDAAAPAEQSPGFFSRIFGGVASTPAPTPTPTPMATPNAAETAAATGTNAVAPVAAPTPAVFSMEQYKQMTGQDIAPGDYTDANGRPFSVR